jgi:hypothetical protein
MQKSKYGASVNVRIGTPVRDAPIITSVAFNVLKNRQLARVAFRRVMAFISQAWVRQFWLKRLVDLMDG